MRFLKARKTPRIKPEPLALGPGFESPRARFIINHLPEAETADILASLAGAVVAGVAVTYPNPPETLKSSFIIP